VGISNGFKPAVSHNSFQVISILLHFISLAIEDKKQMLGSLPMSTCGEYDGEKKKEKKRRFGD
jgi:hypothetical protein